MAKTIVIFLTLAVLVAHCRVLKDKEHERNKRSCHVCDHGDPHGLPPPPPPPGYPPPPRFFRTQNWSGLARSADGSQQGVFSGAAAAADLGPQDAGQAFSLASSSAGAGAKLQESGNGRQFAGFGGQTAANTQAQFGTGQNGNGFRSKNTAGFGGQQFRAADYKEYHQSSKHFEGHGGSAGGQGFGGQSNSGQGGYTGGSAQASSGSKSHSAGGDFGYGPGPAPAAARYHEQQAQSSASGFGSGFNSASSSQSQSGAASGGDGSVVSGGSAGAGSGQEALSGALNLASQGLQSAQQTGTNGCSTCGKSNYALSNAKSHSGNAVAVSIGG